MAIEAGNTLTLVPQVSPPRVVSTADGKDPGNARGFPSTYTELAVRLLGIYCWLG